MFISLACRAICPSWFFFHSWIHFTIYLRGFFSLKNRWEVLSSGVVHFSWSWCCTSFDPVEHVPTKNRTRLVLSKVLLMHYSQYRAMIFKNCLFALKNIAAPRSSTQPLRMTSLARHKYTTSFRGLPMFAWATYAWFRLLFKPYITWHAPLGKYNYCWINAAFNNWMASKVTA